MGLIQSRREHPTQLRVRGPSPQPHRALGATVEGARVSRYTSAGHSLVGLYGPRPPAAAAQSPGPALLYLHGGWALDDDHLRACAGFRRAGFGVFAPAYRGENGNPGVHEMIWGELDDALAALDHVRALPEVDPSRVYVAGHSAGGMLAALMAFVPDLDARLCASINGIYGPEVFDYQRPPPPFVDTPLERSLRLALPHIEQLEQAHIAFVGARDPGRAATFAAHERAAAAGVPLEAVLVPGDHDQSVAPALAAFLDCALRVL